MEIEIRPLLYALPLLQVPGGEEPPHTDESKDINESRPQKKNRKKKGEQDLGDPELPSSTVYALPI